MRNATRPIRVLSNPVAYRILTAAGMRGPQTTSDFARLFRDVPLSSLYRQLARLRDAKLLRVVSERRARGTVERTYALASRDSAGFASTQLAEESVSELRSMLRNFVIGMAADLSTFIESRGFRRNRLHVNAGLAVAMLTDEEYLNMVKELNAVLTRRRTRAAGSQGAKRRYFYLVALPEMSSL
jgi:DNA-binding transcriptional ArsR family regulator